MTKETVEDLRRTSLASVEAAATIEELDNARRQLLGKKGSLTQILKGLGGVDPELRKELGSLVNQLKGELDGAIELRRKALSSAKLDQALEREWIDVSLPVHSRIALADNGGLHPLTRVQRELEHIFRGLGFTVVDGPEVETDYCNFEALNIPDTHPARDMQDTFFTTCGHLLRTHTSSIQVRSLQRMKPPLRIVAPGRCFRYERLDASHEHTFYQMEGMMIDRHVTVGHLIYFMRTLLREIFGGEQKIRLRPGYFPFVEPGFELDIWFQGRWLELLPCGLVHPKVLEFGGIDSSEWNGFAFGLGLSRLVMSRFQIDDIRHLQSGDLRFAKQFR